jgi:hypothetical protein
MSVREQFCLALVEFIQPHQTEPFSPEKQINKFRTFFFCSFVMQGGGVDGTENSFFMMTCMGGN